DAVSGHRDDAVLLHLEDALGSRLSSLTIWRGRTRTVGDLIRSDDHPDERGQYVCDGRRDADGARVEHYLLNLGGRGNRSALCNARRAAIGDHQLRVA